MPRLVFDVDGVLANFCDGILSLADELGGYEGMPCCWRTVARYDFFPARIWDMVKADSSFWLGLKRMPGVRTKMISGGIFPDLYLTSRPVPSDVTATWLGRNLLPTAKVVTVARAEDKIHFLEKGDVFVDDLPKTVRAARDAGVTALLYEAPFHRGLPEETFEGLTKIKCVSEVARYIN